MTQRHAPDQEIQIPIPLRPDVTVRIWIPADLKKSEAERIARVVQGFANGELPRSGSNRQEEPC